MTLYSMTPLFILDCSKSLAPINKDDSFYGFDVNTCCNFIGVTITL